MKKSDFIEISASARAVGDFGKSLWHLSRTYKLGEDTECEDLPSNPVFKRLSDRSLLQLKAEVTYLYSLLVVNDGQDNISL